ncbi:MAG: NnrS family protein [Hyphomicrobiales bacterium]
MNGNAISQGNDRSVPRQRRRSGDMSRDGRGRVSATPAILSYGFRPFFFLAALHAGIAIPAWLSMYLSGYAPHGPFPGLQWHAHEMLFGYLQAVIAGFVLTAIPNWTGRLPLSGWPLAGLVLLWGAGRAANAAVPDPVAAMAVDAAFPIVLAFAVWREVLAGRNWKNAPVAVMISLFGAANILDHAASLGLAADGFGIRLALAAVAMLLALIGGRIVPSFTRNWLVKQGETALPASMGMLDKAALTGTAAACLAWIAASDATITGLMLIVAGSLLGARLARWRGHRTARAPIVLVLHLGYAWLAVALALLGGATILPGIPPGAALHALTAGAAGTMTLAVMTRASLGHTGRDIVADRYTVAAYAAVTAGAVLRVAAPFSDGWHAAALSTGGALWSAAFLIFALRYAPILWGRRKPG